MNAMTNTFGGQNRKDVWIVAPTKDAYTQKLHRDNFPVPVEDEGPQDTFDDGSWQSTAGVSVILVLGRTSRRFEYLTVVTETNEPLPPRYMDTKLYPHPLITTNIVSIMCRTNTEKCTFKR